MALNEFRFAAALLTAAFGFLIPSTQVAAWERPWASTAGALAIGASVSLIPVPEEGSPWKNPVDSFTRDLLRDRDPDGRMRSRVYSDIGLTLSITAPIANTVFSGYQSEDLRADRQDREWMTFTSVNALASNWILTEILKRLTARTRPRASSCDENEPLSCIQGSARDAHKSFPSGHTSFAFTGAGLICLHANQVRTGELFLAGDIWCPAALGVATITGLFRVHADEHWLTDILVGAGTGLLSSLIVAPAISGSRPSHSGATQKASLASPPAIPVLMFRW